MPSLKARLQNGETLIGSLLTLPAPEVAEVMSLAGFDYLWIDMEHAPIDVPHAQRMIQAVGGRCPCLIRVPENAEVWIKRALDTGCDGLVLPQVRTAAEAREAVERCLYPPAGKRSVGMSRAHGYGMSFGDYVASANAELVIVVQIESREGVRNADSIIAVPGIDAALVGPFDLSGSMGVLGDVEHPRVREGIDRVRECCEKAGVPAGIFAVDAGSAKRLAQEGFRLIALGMDSLFLVKSARAALAEAR